MRRSRLAAALLLLVAPPLLVAQDAIPATSGFGGSFLLAPGVFSGRSNMISSGPPLLAPISRERIPSIDAGPDAVTAMGLLVGGEVNYTLASSGTQLFLGQRLEDLLRLDAAFGLGVRQRLPDSSVLTVNGFVTPLQVRIWVDPYLEDLPREEIGVGFPGFRVRWANILRSGLAVTFTDRFWRLPEERSGEQLASEGRLDAADLPLLDRRGDAWDLQASYRLPVIARRHRFEPAIAYSRDDFDGAAMANEGGAVRVRYRYLAPGILVDAHVGYGRRRADAVHPIYGERLTSDRVGFALGVFVPVALRGDRGWNVFGAIESLTEDVNVDFFDSRLTSLTVGFAWRSGRQ